MKKLSDRLQLMADQILRGESVADIGTDHGFLPIYLLENNISPFVIMADISKGSLEKAKQNFDEFLDCSLGNMAFKDKAIFRLGSGLEVINEKEVDTIAIAGMGGLLMIDLLSENFEKTCGFKKYILQPRSGIGHLRHYLKKRGFNVVSEKLVDEDGNICSVIVALPPNFEASIENPFGNDKLWYKKYTPSNDEEYPKTLIKENPILGKTLIEQKIKKLHQIKNEIELKADEENKNRLEIIEDKINYLEEMVN